MKIICSICNIKIFFPFSSPYLPAPSGSLDSQSWLMKHHDPIHYPFVQLGSMVCASLVGFLSLYLINYQVLSVSISETPLYFR